METTSTKNILNRVSKTLLFLSLISYLSINNVVGLTISGPSSFCPGDSTLKFIISDFPPLTGSWGWAAYKTSTIPVPTSPLPPLIASGSWAGGPPVGGSATITFSDIVYVGPVVIYAYASVPLNTVKAHRLVYQAVKKPAQPNYGEPITGCIANEEISIFSLPRLTFTPNDCKFHCEYNWTAPSGFLFTKTGSSNSNPMWDAEKIKFPSGLSSGYQGELGVTALYVRCGRDGNSSTATTPIVYGTPPVLNPTIGYDCYCSPPLSFDLVPGAEIQWTLLTANAGASITPVANTNLCATHNMEWGIVELKLTNRCGSTYYNFYVDTGTMYSVYPNPAANQLTIEFKNDLVSEHLTKKVTLYDENGRIVRAFHSKEQIKIQGKKLILDVRNIKSGNYFLHLQNGKNIKKSQVIIR